MAKNKKNGIKGRKLILFYSVAARLLLNMDIIDSAKLMFQIDNVIDKNEKRKKIKHEQFNLRGSTLVIENPKRVYDPNPLRVSRRFMSDHFILLRMLSIFFDPHYADEEEEDEDKVFSERELLRMVRDHSATLRRFVDGVVTKEREKVHPMEIPRSVVEKHLMELNKCIPFLRAMNGDPGGRDAELDIDEYCLTMGKQLLTLKRYEEKRKEGEEEEEKEEEEEEEEVLHFRP